MHITHEEGSLSGRSAAFIDTDKAVVRWIAQAAVNVELFTIPLYMTSLYSITGMHPITGAGNDFYQGRVWPGAKTAFFTEYAPGKPGWGNKRAFNIVFSIFIQEMLHLQMAANLATAVGAAPSFTATALQNEENGWTCYGPTLTEIPGIVDLTDTNRFKDVKVNVGPLDAERTKLFLAIEQPQETAEADIVRNKHKYFPKVPFTDDPDYDLAAHIMFGSIGYMYQCYRDYLQIEYDDGTTLWHNVFTPSGQQNDLFNNFSFPGHPMREFMGFETTIAGTDPGIALEQALNMMNAITDQGEGATLDARVKHDKSLVQGDVKKQYCPSDVALKSDYPSYSDTGDLIPSSDAAARSENDGVDHYQRFRYIEDILGNKALETWDKSPKPGKWQASDLITKDYPANNPYGLPEPAHIAGALNNLHNAGPEQRKAYYNQMSQAVCGAIKGVTTVLDQYWAGNGSFPFPSMAGSGDRMSTAWAVFGECPDLSIGVGKPDTSILNHACQGLSLADEGGKYGANDCALTPIYHTCRGSNACKGMSGCGFVQLSTGGGSCGGGGGSCGTAKAPAPSTTPVRPPVVTPQGGNCSAVQMRAQGGLCGAPTPSPTPAPTPSSCGAPTPTPSGPTYTAPSDNICAGYGGCAVPISALQLYPKSGTMDVYMLSGSPTPSSCGTPTPTPHGCSAPDANGEKGKNLCGTPTPSPTPSGCSTPATNKKIGTIDFAAGQKVEDIAFQAFSMVVKAKGGTASEQAKPNDLRLAFPPST